MALPTFLLIGAGKSGTTSLQNYLSQHPDVYMPKVKEPNFFALEGQTKITGYDEEDPEGFFHYPWSVTNKVDYEKLFDNATYQKAKGEASTMYMYMPNAPQNIKKYVPEVKLIAILRNPAERLYSRYMHLVREDRAPSEKLEDCFDKDSIWWKKNDLVQEGFYYKHLHRYFDLFPKNQIKVFLHDELRANPQKVISEMYHHIGVSNDFEPKTDIEFNPSGKIKNPMVDKLIGQKSLLKKAVNSIAPVVVEKLKNSHLAQKTLVGLRKKNMEKAPLNKELKQKLIQEIYLEDINKLEKLLGKDLTSWK